MGTFGSFYNNTHVLYICRQKNRTEHVTCNASRHDTGCEVLLDKDYTVHNTPNGNVEIKTQSRLVVVTGNDIL